MQSETETAIMMQTHLQQLERPYPIISYGKEVAMQTGTLIVVEPSPDGNDVVTHSHPVVSYANRDKVKLDPKSGRYIPDGGQGGGWECHHAMYRKRRPPLMVHL